MFFLLKFRQRALYALLLILLSVFALRPAAYAAPGDEQLKEAMRRILQENPDILLDVLSEHSDELLNIMQNAAESRRVKAMTDNWNKDAKEPKQINFTGRAIEGDKNAPVTIVAYSDFLCPYCKQATDVVDEALKAHPKEVRFVFKNYPLIKLHPFAEIAAKYYIAACLQDNDKAVEYHALLFAGQDRLAKDGEAYLQEAAKGLGLDVDRLVKDANGGKVAAMLAEDQGEARSMGIKGAPFLVINNLILPGAPDSALLEEAIQKALSLR